MFFENRAIQGSSGSIYPHPLIARLSDKKIDRTYTALILENEYLEVVLLPELGGRIFSGRDKTNGYDFFYRHEVIKPALIGLCGPWISGGVEFNWPQHHRPTTLDPTHYAVEDHEDGSVTVWMGEHEPLDRTKGMVGVCLHPGKAYVETKVRLYNRTDFTQGFMWWANAAVPINEQYQVVFPPDVHFAVNHHKTPVTPYPSAGGKFNNQEYIKGTDLSFWANSKKPVSFFAGPSSYDFFGGYDHARQAGVVHLADCGVSPGKKFFTWGNDEFGHRWQRCLKDTTAEYLELMAGVYTDNQPDFSWIMPHETKTFSQYWFPIQKIGAMKNANLHGAVNLEVKSGMVSVGIYGIEKQEHARLLLTAKGQTLVDQEIDLAPGYPVRIEVPLPENIAEQELLLRVEDFEGDELIGYKPEAPWEGKMPAPFEPPLSPENTKEIEQLYLSGLHIDQYRHPVLKGEMYWKEALRRDPGDSRCNVALGFLRLRNGLFEEAETHFRKALERLTSWNQNPAHGEASYGLGLALVHQQKFSEAGNCFAKGAWSYAWKSACYCAMTQINIIEGGQYKKALENIHQAFIVNQESLKIRNLKAAVLRRLDKLPEAESLAAATGELDRLDVCSRFELYFLALKQGKQELAEERLNEIRMIMDDDGQLGLDTAFDYISSGLYEEAASVLRITSNFPGLSPMTAYTLGWIFGKMGRNAAAAEWFAKGAKADSAFCFPSRLEEISVLQMALQVNPDDANASYYLGNLLYSKQQSYVAANLWKKAATVSPGFFIPWRNLGIEAYNKRDDLDEALGYFQKAVECDSRDLRLLVEYDELKRIKGVDPEERLAFLENQGDLIEQSQELLVALMGLYNRLGCPEKALKIATGHHFYAWEGDEGVASRCYTNAHWLLGRKAMESGDWPVALAHFQQATVVGENLVHQAVEEIYAHAVYYRGLTLDALGKPEEARKEYEWIIDPARIRERSVVPMESGLQSHSPYYGMALVQLGRKEEGLEALRQLKKLAEDLARCPLAAGYFRLGRPNPIFRDDEQKRHQIKQTCLSGLAAIALGDRTEARRLLGEALALEPDNLFAWEEYRRL